MDDELEGFSSCLGLCALDQLDVFGSVSLPIPIGLVFDIFNIGGRGTKNAKSQCGTGSEGQRT